MTDKVTNIADARKKQGAAQAAPSSPDAAIQAEALESVKMQFAVTLKHHLPELAENTSDADFAAVVERMLQESIGLEPYLALRHTPGATTHTHFAIQWQLDGENQVFVVPRQPTTHSEAFQLALLLGFITSPTARAYARMQGIHYTFAMCTPESRKVIL